MKVWMALPFFPMSTIPDLVVAAEQLGVEGVTVGDHVCVPAEVTSEYPYTGQPAVLPVGTEFPDPLTLVSYLGGRTTTMRFVTHVLLAPLRHPILVAKEVATVAGLTGERFELGVGVGWMQQEFDAVGIPFEERGKRMDEMLPLLRQLWTGEVVEHHGRFYDFEPITQHPVPPAPVPILVGGHSAPALRRAATFADGWMAVNPKVEELEGILRLLEEARRAAGTLDRPFVIRSGLRGGISPDKIAALAKMGVDAMIIMAHQLLDAGAPVYELPVDAVLERIPRFVEMAANA